MQSEPTMNVNESASGRHGLLSRLFPAGVPRLWCPMLTHFAAARTPDATRIRTHLEWLSPYVHGILVPGSTGEGWEMTDEDIRVLLDLVLDVAHNSNMHVLVGLLNTDVDAMLASLDAMQDLFRLLESRFVHPRELNLANRLFVMDCVVCLRLDGQQHSINCLRSPRTK